ncbi:kinase-like domain-containing protein [Hyaloraphidium curvatum]|nr:kinase-like domain-containing protein [Hyaloraphidium curvatum]
MPAILVNSRGSSATDFSSGRASYASLPSSPRTGTLSNAALQAFRGDEIKSLSGLTLFGDSEGELAALQRNLPPSSSGSDPQPSAAQHSKGTANGKALPPKLVLNSDLSSGKLAAIKESAADAEDRERNSRHREVVELQNGTRPLPPEFVSQYRIGELLGDGAFGFVMTATCLKTGKEVAVKFILREKIASELWTVDPRFGRLPMEVHVLSSLDHPNIVKYLGHFSDADRFIMVTELHGTQWHADNHELNSNRNPGLLKETPTSPHLEGSAAAECSPLHRLTPEQERKIKRRVPCDLFQCIDAHSRLLDSTCRYIFAQIALAVHYMHSKGFIHRDLKDENVVVDADYNVKLIDFGSAARIPRTPDEYFTYSKFNGTLHFAAPEICRRQPYRGPEAEVWSLGVLLFIMVFAESPFATRDDTIKGQFRFPRSDVDPACADLIRRMLTYDEKARITIDEILEHEWLKTDIVSLRRSGRQ